MSEIEVIGPKDKAKPRFTLRVPVQRSTPKGYREVKGSAVRINVKDGKNIGAVIRQIIAAVEAIGKD